MYENVSASQPTRLKNAFDSFTIFPLVVFFFRVFGYCSTELKKVTY